MDLLVWIIVGAIGGFLASFFIKLAWGGLIGSIITGIVGGLLAGWLAGALGINAQVSGFNLGSIVVAFIGAIILSAIVGWISGRR